MVIDLDGPPPAPLWPEGIRVAELDPADERAFHGALEEAFASEWWHRPQPWRRRGLALALLRHAFVAFYARGERRCALGVDTRNPTSARGVYERAGMRVLWQADVFEKELRQTEAVA